MNDTDVFARISNPVDVTVQQIKDLLCNAIEGGSNYWVETITRMGGVTKEQAEYRQDVPFVPGGWLEVVTDDDDKIHELDLKALRRGLVVMAEKYPQHFADVVNDNTDATTGDVFLQCCLFNEVVYG